MKITMDQRFAEAHLYKASPWDRYKQCVQIKTRELFEKTGICRSCERVMTNRKYVYGKGYPTIVHHLWYCEDAPLAGAMEFCEACHRKTHSGFNKLRRNNLKKPISPKKLIYRCERCGTTYTEYTVLCSQGGCRGRVKLSFPE